MTSGWITAGIAAALLIPGLGACGGSTTGTSTSPPAHPGAAVSEPVGSPGPAGAPGALTPPGAHVAVGQTATVRWVPSSMITVKPQQGVKIQVTVVSIGKGTIADFKGLTLDAKERRSTPYYVKVRIKALEPVPPAQLKTTDPANTLNAAGTSDVSPEYYQLPPGLFTPCNQVDVPKPFGSGQSYQSCRVYLMPAGGQQITMTWDSGSHERNQGSPYFTKPIEWAGN